MSMTDNSCPCCGGSLLRHVRHGELYWFCQTCWQEVPVLTVGSVSSVERKITPILPQPVANS
jgi:uncharacterized Zn finger protein (UPF0148 family)